MDLSIAQRAEVLIQALPYIQKYNDKIIVVKYGGNAMISGELREAVMGDIALLSLIGIKVVLVHGGGPETTELLNKMGKKSEFIDGLRVTDEETAEAVLMVIGGKINKSLVNQLGGLGGRAMGLCGMDGRMIEAARFSEQHGFVGEVTKINPAPILDVLKMGYIPVISTVGIDPENPGIIYNINADTAAAHIAGALGAESLILMTNIRGLLRDRDDPDSLIPRISAGEAPRLMSEGVITGGMIPKVECCVSAIKSGVGRVFIIDGRVPHAILIEVLSDEGVGTMVTE